MYKVHHRKKDTEMPLQRPGPSLPTTCEADLVAWIATMQQNGFPMYRAGIIVKANQLIRRLDPTRSLTGGWYRRFIGRHPNLVNRVAQVISNARNGVDMSGVQRLYESLDMIMAEHNLTPDCMFNMDETAFETRRKTKKVP
ncbi:hypothetical protein B5M09_007329 [Aphanomyces astaci]|uniref:HTH CENPB-type domain-containing protein n=1 Tax=Aphanomyces astaci TaxID=112090 RepID=A0A3R7Y6C2_APHAT|nr:hypothetical protein B5M09_007329 [Aphanomyces astaci]